MRKRRAEGVRDVVKGVLGRSRGHGEQEEREALLHSWRAVARERAAALADREAAARDRSDAARIREEAESIVARAAIDELTGALTRRFGLEELDRQLERAHRAGASLVLVFVDVDGLKTVNDLHGHQVGDELLALIGEVVRAHLRPYDVVVRYGGDEFVCVTPNLGKDDARGRFEEIAGALRAVDPEHSISFGLAESVPGEGLQQLMIRADADLLRSRGGRRSSR